MKHTDARVFRIRIEQGRCWMNADSDVGALRRRLVFVQGSITMGNIRADHWRRRGKQWSYAQSREGLDAWHLRRVSVLRIND
jgi:hypothetical protein